MAITYKEQVTGLGWKYIEATDTEKPDSLIVIPINEFNADYQLYLRWLENPDADESGTL